MMEERGGGILVSASKTLTGFSSLVLVAVLAQNVVLSSDKLTPSGVPLSRAALYDPQKDFSCLDGSKLIPFSFVNDEYCDCADGSDEPGTSACSRGSFYCQNAGHVSMFIPSSRVGDRICDCCDGSDEGPASSCTNTCDELGRAAREAAEVQARLLKDGFGKRQGMSDEGTKSRKEREGEKARLESERRRLEAVKEEKAKVKEELEAPEKEALERVRLAEEEVTRKREEEEAQKEQIEAETTFTLLDSNGDGKIEKAEVQARQTFDKNKDGVVDEEEARFFLNLEEELEKEEWVKSAWTLAKPFFLMEQGMFKAPPPIQEGEDHEEVEEVEPLGGGQEVNVTPEPPLKEYDDEEVEEILQKESQSKGANKEEGLPGVVAPEDEEEMEEEEEEEEESPPPAPEGSKYDEETQRLIDQAEAARGEFNEAERNVADVVRQLEELNDILNVDFGEDERWAVLHGQCYDFEDREYVYTLCPFKSASQKGRSGGGEVSLGKWGSWVGEGEGEAKYSAMLYDRGQSCWNGPNRSARVNIVCGLENRLVGVSEPSRCEYHFEFTSPAGCPKPDSVAAPTQHQQHTEL